MLRLQSVTKSQWQTVVSSTYRKAEFIWMWSSVVKQSKSVRSLHHVMVQWMS